MLSLPPILCLFCTNWLEVIQLSKNKDAKHKRWGEKRVYPGWSGNPVWHWAGSEEIERCSKVDCSSYNFLLYFYLLCHCNVSLYEVICFKRIFFFKFKTTKKNIRHFLVFLEILTNVLFCLEIKSWKFNIAMDFFLSTGFVQFFSRLIFLILKAPHLIKLTCLHRFLHLF